MLAKHVFLKLIETSSEQRTDWSQSTNETWRTRACDRIRWKFMLKWTDQRCLRNKRFVWVCLIRKDTKLTCKTPGAKIQRGKPSGIWSLFFLLFSFFLLQYMPLCAKSFLNTNGDTAEADSLSFKIKVPVQKRKINQNKMKAKKKDKLVLVGLSFYLHKHFLLPVTSLPASSPPRCTPGVFLLITWGRVTPDAKQ